MLDKIVFVTGALLVFATFSGAAKIPQNWGTCKRGDTDVDNCLKLSIQRAIADLKNGSQKLGLNPLDPFKISHIYMKDGTPSINLELSLTDVDLLGLPTAQVTNVRSDLDNYKIDFDVFIPKMVMTVKEYVLKGRILVVPMNSVGNSTITMSKSTVHIHTFGVLHKNSKGKTHMTVDKYTFQLIPENTRFDLHDSTNPQQGQLIGRILTENNQEIMKELMPTISEAFSVAFKDYSNRIYSKVPFDDIFPPQ